MPVNTTGLQKIGEVIVMKAAGYVLNTMGELEGDNKASFFYTHSEKLAISLARVVKNLQNCEDHHYCN